MTTRLRQRYIALRRRALARFIAADEAHDLHRNYSAFTDDTKSTRALDRKAKAALGKLRRKCK